MLLDLVADNASEMSISPDGSLLAVGSQYSNRTVVYERDIATDILGDLVATADFTSSGNVTCVVWGSRLPGHGHERWSS